MDKNQDLKPRVEFAVGAGRALTEQQKIELARMASNNCYDPMPIAKGGINFFPSPPEPTPVQDRAMEQQQEINALKETQSTLRSSLAQAQTKLKASMERCLVLETRINSADDYIEMFVNKLIQSSKEGS